MAVDKVLLNGHIYSVNSDGSFSEGSALAISEGKITALGNNEEIKRYADENTEVIDCKGNTIMPGLIDSHCHPISAASIFENCSLFDITGTPEETGRDVIDKYVLRMKEFIDENPDMPVYRGTGWNRAFFSGSCREPQWPTRQDLDRICPDKPVVLESYCQHLLWVNSKAIELSGLSAETSDPEYGSFTREEDGYPAGVFFEMDGINLIKENMKGYDYTVEQYRNTLLRFQEEIALPFGLLCADDCATTENAITAMKQLASEGLLKMRLRGVYLLKDCKDLSAVDAISDRAGSDNVGDTFRIDTIKTFIEGEPALTEPYLPEANRERGLPDDYAGIPFYDDDDLMKCYEKAAKAGLQIHIHAMGGKSIHQAVKALSYAQNKTGQRNRNVIAHHMEVSDEDIKAMAENDILANVQPRWMVYDADAAENYTFMVGKERACRVYPNKRFLDAGCGVVYGTDFPVTEINPFCGIECAITRCVYEGGEGYEQYKGIPLGPEENPKMDCVSLKDAVRSYTYMGAYQNFMEDITGSIEVGKSADIVILDKNIDAVPVTEIHKILPVRTIFKGETVYSR